LLRRYIVALFFLVTVIISANIEVVESFKNNSTYLKKRVYKNRVSIVHLKAKPKHHKVKKRKKQINRGVKVVIIIDDIAHKWQLNKVQKLPFKVTPSIFPPNKMNMHNNLLAKGLKHFMVHLPLESSSKQMNRMYQTLFRSASSKEIEQRVIEIRKLFPNAHYLNNHTGSLFTQNYRASKLLYKALLKYGFIFLDSRTTKKTVIPKIAKEFKKKYLKSDLFIDNSVNVNSIINEIHKGLAFARKRGYVVMIGHPHLQTFQALLKSRNVLKHYNLIYIDELK